MDGGTDIRIVPMTFEPEMLVDVLPELRRYARSLTRNPHDADDLVQEMCVKALEYRHLFLGGNFVAWVTQIMKNSWRSEIKRRIGQATTQAFDTCHMVPDTATPADDRVYAKEVVTIVDNMRPVFRDTMIAHVLCESFGSVSAKENGRTVRVNHANEDHRLAGEMIGVTRLLTINQRICRARAELAAEVA